ncbi:hypothetical protein CIW52_01820 [Mycolicibacterium sp. P9-64]|uniref:Nramp family divalent metal transporter n=1 Tax=Mycolicibacterium sp. P9-64 TaxID=2024612 RepID=UPI0011EE6699|nr:Nramp family divalent metal transporter [Mycolicibacterium sp. P9-64]KAA0086675.1 hypothetical protein CIW52_01820 [Mycolicibacterium sp. P9-64]
MTVNHQAVQRSSGRAKTGHLPDFEVRELPEPMSLKKMIGPGIVLVAIGVGSGEYISHPYITSQVGLTFVWSAIAVIMLQYFINTEVVRYTLATGETIITGFTRRWRGWAPLFIAMTVIPFAWPGWMSAAATLITYTAGGGSVKLIAIIGLLTIGLVLTLSPVVYQTVEKLEFFKVIAILAFAVFAILFVIGWRPWAELPGATLQGIGRLPSGVPTTFLITAMVFAGGGGAVNLAISNWIRDKGWGMGAHAPRVVSPITNKEEAGSSTGFEFELTDENKAHWTQWWRNAKIEQFWSFGFVASITIVVFVLIAYSVLGVGNYQGKGDLSFIQMEANLLAEKFGDFTKIAFLLIGSVALMFANLVVVDLVARITADVLAVNYIRGHKFWTEAKVYATVVWAVVIMGVGILAAGLTQPVALLAIAAVLNGLVMVVYCALLVRLNRSLNPFIAMKNGRTAILLVSMIFYMAFTAYVIKDQIGLLL